MFKELNTLELFFENPTREYNVREVARLLKITPATASKQLKRFAEKKILHYKKERTYDLYKSNIDNTEYRDLKVYYTIRKIRNTGIIEELNKYYYKPTIILYGSMSTGYDVENSDVDLIIVSERKKEFEKQRVYEKKLKKKIQLFIVNDLNELKNEYLINNVLNGIVLQGEIQWTWKNAKRKE